MAPAVDGLLGDAIPAGDGSDRPVGQGRLGEDPYDLVVGEVLTSHGSTSYVCPLFLLPSHSTCRKFGGKYINAGLHAAELLNEDQPPEVLEVGETAIAGAKGALLISSLWELPANMQSLHDPRSTLVALKGVVDRL